VGDWPLAFRLSEIRYKKSVGSVIKYLYSFLILLTYLLCSKNTHYIFVNEKEYISAKNFGFKNALYIPLGVNQPSVPLIQSLNITTICFTGNFNYMPNYFAARDLINAFKNEESIKLLFIGHYSTLLRELSSKIECFSGVESIVDELAKIRPVYVSYLKLGAGAKNKILEALIAGCPVIATPESLDPSMYDYDTIFLYTEKNLSSLSIISLIDNISAQKDKYLIKTQVIADKIKVERSWENLSIFFKSLIIK
jgi:glycosyltransferase involved in cell wall biosynthesis